MEAEECLWNLSNLRTLESVDICFYLLDKLLLALHTQYQQQQRRQEQLRATANAAMDKNKQQQQPSEENFHPNPSSSPPPPQLDAFLTNWELWHSVLINWHQVSKTTLTEAMAKKNARRQQVQHDSGSSSSLDSYLVTSPAKLLAMLDGWNELVASTQNHLQTWQQQQQPPFSCTTSKTLSLLIDITARRGRILAEQKGPSHPPSASGLVQEAELAEKLLLDMMKKVDRPSGNRCPPSASNLNMVLMLWGKAGRVDEAWSLLKRASLVVTPDAISYNSILEGYAAVGNGPAAEKILFALCRPNSPVPPDVNTWNIVLAAWARFADKALAAQRVEQMLVAMVEFGIGNIDCDDLEQWGDDMDSLADSPGKPISPYRRVALWSNSNLLPTFGMHRPPIIRPNLSTFNTVLSVWARAGEAETCARLLGEMWDLHWEGRLDDPPDRVSYATVMNAFAKAGQPEKAEALADEMFKSYTQHGMVELKPTLANLTAVLDAYSRQIGDAVTKKDVKLALISLQRAQKMFQRMRYLYQFGYLEFCPDTTAYNVMLTCCLRCGSLNTAPQVNASAEIADTLLQEMKQMAGRHDKLSAPGFKTYSLVIQSWLLRPDGGRRAQALLQEIWDAQAIHQAPVQLRPDSLSLHCVIIGFCRELPFAALNLLLKVCEMIQHDPLSIVEPRLASFGSVLGALCRSNLPNAPGMSLDLVRRMEKLHQAGMIKQGPDRLMYRTLITVWAYADHIPGNAQTALSILSELRRRGLRNKDMLPDLRTYNQVLFALSRNNAAPAQAERLLRQMHDDYKNKVSSEKPDIRSFNSVLSAWARCTDPTSIARANSLFHEMQLLHQAGALLCDVVTYNIILNCLARSFRREGAIRAEQIVFQMNEMSATGNTAFRPNAVTYGCLIAAWLRVNDANRAATVLFDMHAAYTMGDEQMKPQFRHFQQVSVALSKIGDATSTEKLKHLSSVKDLFYSESIDQNFQNQRITKADP